MPAIEPKAPEYDFDYHPKQLKPEVILHAEQLTHVFFHPDSRRGTTQLGGYSHRFEIYNRLPKRKGALTCRQNDGFPTGFGIEFVEGLNWWLLGVFGLPIIACALFVAILYAAFGKGEDKFGPAVTIGSNILGIGSVAFCVLVGLWEMMEAWRY